jgi:hypothetical protein
MWITHSYLGTTRGDVRCLFFLLHEDYIEAQSGLSDRVRQEIERFARNMGTFGAVVAPFTGDVESTRQHILDKPWSDADREKIRQTPAMLMIDQDFDDFDPREHRWVILHLGGDEGDAGLFRSLMQKLVEALPEQNSDPFYLISEALQKRDIAAATEMIELKPGAFGVSIDLKRAWKSMKKFLRARKSNEAGA